MGRRKNSVVRCLEQIQKINYEPPPLQDACPTLDKVVKSNEMHLFDLSSLQLELERLLTSITERLACLSAESKGHELPPEMMNALHLLNSSNDPDSGQSALAGPSLVVKANPDKPLTLIISQRSRTLQHHSAISSLDASIGDRTKPGHSIPCVRRSSRSSIDENTEQSPASSPDKNQSSSYAIPNKFWELMEPYCADITEANISYLEALIRSYQDMEASYFQLPPLTVTETVQSEPAESIASKRPKREAAPSPAVTQSSETTNFPDTLAGVASTSNIIHIARHLEKEIKSPCSESSAMGKLSQSLLNSCYQENIMFAFAEGVERLNVNHSVPQTPGNVDEMDKNQPESTTDWRSSTQDDSDTNMTEDDEATSCPNLPDSPYVADHTAPPMLPTSIRTQVTARASQPLKNVAKQMHLTSSYRVEKKIAQAVDELGLFPLNLIHSPLMKQPDTATKGEDYRSVMLNSHLYTGPNFRTAPSPIARLKIKASALESPATNQEGASFGNQSSSPAVHPSAKRRYRSTGHNKICSPRASANNTSRLSNARWADSGTARVSRSGAKHEQGAEPTSHPINGLSRSTRNSSHRESKKLRSAEYRGKLRKSLYSPARHNGCNGLAVSENNQLVNLSPKNTVDYRLVNGPVGVEEPVIDAGTFADNDGHPGDDDDGYSVGSRSRIRISHSDQTKHYRSGGDRLLSPDPNPCFSSRSSCHSAPFSTGACAAESFTEAETKHSTCQTDQRTFNGDVFIFDHDDTAVTGEKLGDERPSGDNPPDPDTCPIHSPTLEHNSKLDPSIKCSVKSAEWSEIGPTGIDCDAPRDRLLRLPVEHKFESDLSFLLNEVALDTDKLAKSLGSSNPDGRFVQPNNPAACLIPMDEVGWAILQRQHELRMVCAANHSVLRRLVQAARRDVQRQEIQRRLAIADADVIEAYNKLESYRPLRKPPLKRDRDVAWKALKERRKILKELEAFDSCSP
ncbi:Transcriptional adapter 3 [Fasciola gigantica]|uniref:Transcriptional adapter 3 n=1 Tax=Fasciola gigantica TaxID=46835 RepID=A0A504Z6L5_FASGI|nr:Transcriptional adapter 3 [Fasciola gigantica]